MKDSTTPTVVVGTVGGGGAEAQAAFGEGQPQLVIVHGVVVHQIGLENGVARLEKGRIGRA